VHFDAAGVPPGNYTLYLESFDANSPGKTTLKTDTVIVSVGNSGSDRPRRALKTRADCPAEVALSLNPPLASENVLLHGFTPAEITFHFPEIFFLGPHTQADPECAALYTYTQEWRLEEGDANMNTLDFTPSGDDKRPTWSIHYKSTRRSAVFY